MEQHELSEDLPPDNPELAIKDFEAGAFDRAPLTEPSAAALAFDEWLDQAPRALLESLQPRRARAAYWPADDSNAPDYAHLSEVDAPARFTLRSEDLEALIAANRFQPKGAGNVLALALRGAMLPQGFEKEKAVEAQVDNLRPDHHDYRCLLGFYYQSEGRFTLFAGSTVPAPYYMQQYYNQEHGLPHETNTKCNLLPTACYMYRVGHHRDIEPALRATEPGTNESDATVTVLRTRNDLTFEHNDVWDMTTPYDNVHCAYFINYSEKYEAAFSSAGCLTVRGRKTPSDQWKKYQAVLNNIGPKKRVDLILLTGKECAIAAKLREAGMAQDPPTLMNELVRLRVGSQGEEVKRLQKKLGMSGTGYFGAATRRTLITFQGSQGLRKDGLYSPALDKQLGWQVFTEAVST